MKPLEEALEKAESNLEREREREERGEMREERKGERNQWTEKLQSLVSRHMADSLQVRDFKTSQH